MQLTDAHRRALRTFVQAFLGSILASGVLSSVNTDGVVDWSLAYKVIVSAFAAAVIALLSFVQNTLENHDVVPTVLKPKDAGIVDFVMLTFLLALIAFCLAGLCAIGYLPR